MTKDIKRIPISDIVSRDYTQARVDYAPLAIENYAELYRDSEEPTDDQPDVLEPVTVLRASTPTGKYFLVDGHHRVRAAELANYTTIGAIVLQPDQTFNSYDALVESAKSNVKNGVARTGQDKRNAVTILLKRYPKTPSAEIAKMAGVSRSFASNIRREMVADGQLEPLPTALATAQEAIESAQGRVISTRELSRETGIPESTLRRARNTLLEAQQEPDTDVSESADVTQYDTLQPSESDVVPIGTQIDEGLNRISRLAQNYLDEHGIDATPSHVEESSNGKLRVTMDYNWEELDQKANQLQTVEIKCDNYGRCIGIPMSIMDTIPSRCEKIIATSTPEPRNRVDVVKKIIKHLRDWVRRQESAPRSYIGYRE